ncbi:MAG: PHP domain-containing protein [Clostridia bacterium]|nr:PHP domain-containing protein [Clostridia bacterium]
MIIDLHNHTTFSYDGQDLPESIIENAIASGINIVGITDHQFTDGFSLSEYVNTIAKLKEKYKNQIVIKTGLEIGTRPKPDNLLAKSASKVLDFCLFESLDHQKGMDLYEFLEWRRLFSCPVGLAHTDIFLLSERYGVDMLRLLHDNDIFWEINTSGNYPYYYDFITNAEKRKKVKESKITLSVGSDTHSVVGYNKRKIVSANELLKELGNKVLFL